MNKSKIIKILLILLLLLVLLVTNKKIKNQKKETKTLKIAEVTHSAFYAPLYVAIEEGYFKENNLNIELILTPGADKVSAAVLSNDVEIGFAGAESALYIYNSDNEDYLKIFCGMTRIDGQFIIGRNQEENFSLNSIKGKEILVGRKGGMPAINFLTALENNNINQDEVNINYSIDFSALAGTFIGGVGDYVNLFEPNATKLVDEGYGYIVGSIGNLSKEVPYTAFYAKKSFIEQNKDTINNFNLAIQKGLDYVNNNDANTIAKSIHKQFSDLSIETLTKIVENYKNINSWFTNTAIPEEAYNNLNNMLIKNKLINKKISYSKIIYKEN